MNVQTGKSTLIPVVMSAHFPKCEKYSVQIIDWRNDRYAIFGPEKFVVSGLTYEQTASLMSHFKSIESKQ
jgi:hypothetical protein